MEVKNKHVDEHLKNQRDMVVTLSLVFWNRMAACSVKGQDQDALYTYTGT